MTFSLNGLVLSNYEKNTNESLLCRYHSLSLHGKKTKGTCNNSTSLNRISINYTSLPNTTTMNNEKKRHFIKEINILCCQYAML